MPLNYMLNDKAVAIIHKNFLICNGIKSMLERTFNGSVIFIFSEFEDFLEKKNELIFEFVFVDSEMYFLYYEQLKNIRKKLISLTERNYTDKDTNSPACLNIHLTKEEITTKLKDIFSTNTTEDTDSQDALSSREMDVLKYVALGFQNKQIAEQLCISSHTVISHRKNITRKLGLNSVSGLTVYALINGIITSEDIQNH